MNRFLFDACRFLSVFICAILAMSPAVAQSRYTVKYLVSDDGSVPGTKIDPNLVDPWGLAFDPYGYAAVASPGSRAITRYDGDGNLQPPVIRAIDSGESPVTPLGLVFNGSNNFMTWGPEKVGPSRLLIAAQESSLHGWNSDVDPEFARRVGGAYTRTYTGIAVSGCCGRQLLYVAWPEWRVLVYETDYRYNPMVEGSFYDPNTPSELTSYNIQAIAGNLYVSYAQHDVGRKAYPGAGSGLVNVFNPTGRFIRRVATGGPLNAPWGMAMAPAEFGTYSNKLLVGNTGDGRINVFDPNTGTHLGVLRDSAGNPIVIEGLHALQFGNGVANQTVNTLFFTAGPSNGTRGRYGKIFLIR